MAAGYLVSFPQEVRVVPFREVDLVGFGNGESIYGCGGSEPWFLIGSFPDAICDLSWRNVVSAGRCISKVFKYHSRDVVVFGWVSLINRKAALP